MNNQYNMTINQYVKCIEYFCSKLKERKFFHSVVSLLVRHQTLISNFRPSINQEIISSVAGCLSYHWNSLRGISVNFNPFHKHFYSTE